MKLKIFILASFCFCMLPMMGIGCGCGYRSYDHLFFQIMGDEVPKSDFADQNCLLWQRQTSMSVSVEDIKEAIYQFSLEDWQRVLDNGCDAENAFVKYLIYTLDTSAMNLLYYSKRYEEVRTRMRNPWYYPLQEDAEHEALREVAAWATKAKSAKYQTRIAFLRAKVLSALGDDQQLLEWWRSNRAALEKDILYPKIEGYVAGAMYRTGDTTAAAEIYLRQDDLVSLVTICSSKAEALRLMLKINPNSETFKYVLQAVLKAGDSARGINYDYRGIVFKAEDLAQIMEVCREAQQIPAVRCKAMWGYTEAALLWYWGMEELALRKVDELDVRGADAYLRQSIRLMQLSFHISMDPVDDKYEKMLFEGMRWLDVLMQKEVKQHPGMVHRYGRYLDKEFCLGDAAMQLLLSDKGACERLKRQGRHVAALQLANYACNRYAQLESGKQRSSVHWLEDSIFYCEWYGEGYFNNHDFSNYMYDMLDELPSSTLIQYWNTVIHPKSAADRFFSTRGQLDADYWNDIIGMMSLRECNYGQAVKYLSKVRKGYQNSTNLRGYMNRDPFRYDAPKCEQIQDCRLAYAKRMNGLEESLMRLTDANDLADSALLLSIGMRNVATGKCWWLAAAHSYELYEYYEEYYSSLEESMQQAMDRQNELQKVALNLYTDPERAAKAYAKLSMVTTVMTRYPHTEQAAYYAKHCDRWRDWI